MRGKAILLVEDNPYEEELALAALKGYLETQDVVVARDGEEALAYLFGPKPDAAQVTTRQPGLILLDLRLPKMDGLEVLKRVRGDARTRDIPVVVLTSSRDEKDIQACYRSGANSFVRKSLEFMVFASAVKEIVNYWFSINLAM
jgi:two-component system, response regulator